MKLETLENHEPSMKNSCVGNLQLFIHTAAHPASSRYLHLSTLTPGTIRVVFPSSSSTSTSFTVVFPMSHWQHNAVTQAFMNRENSGKGWANMTRKAGGSQLGKQLTKIAFDTAVISSRLLNLVLSTRVTSISPSYPSTGES